MWEIQWTGYYPCLCAGEWIIKYNNIALEIPKDIKTNHMNTYGEYNKWSFNEDWNEEWEVYQDGLIFEKWILQNKEWLNPEFERLNIPESELRELYNSINSCDWRHGSCGGCI